LFPALTEAAWVFDTVMVNYAIALQACRSGTIKLANFDFDTGKPTVPGEYGLADKNYDLLFISGKPR